MRAALPKSRPLRIATLTAFVLGFVILSTGIIAALFPASAAASSSSLEVLDGIVALSHDGQTFVEGHDGDLVEQGEVVRTGENSHAVLTFFDGSTIEVEPDSELIVNTLKATSAGDIVMEIEQNVGRSWHVVSRALTPNSKYEVRTPTSVASVRGTAFLVSVQPDGGTNVQTTDGLVHTNAGGVEVQVPPGFQTNVAAGGTPPDAPTPAPPPPSLVRVVLDPTPNAAVTDANGRTVGVLNGLPIRYVPGSTITIEDGKLVITIPNPTLGRIDTHVQPADPKDTSVDVEVIVQVGDTVVGNVIEQRTIGTDGVAKGGVLITTTGTYVLPDDEVKKAPDPRIGRLPPPPPAGFGLPLLTKPTPAPTPIVTPAPSFVPRFDFDPRLVAATQTPPPPSATPRPTFVGGFQPYTDTTTIASATPAPNSSLQVFTSADLTLTRLVAPSPTPTPTLTARLIEPVLLLTPTPSPTPSLVLRTISPILLITVAPTPTPTGTVLILRTITPIFLITPSPTPTDTPLIIRTIDPIFILPTASPTPTPAPTFILRTIDPIIFLTPTPTPAPTFILRTVSPSLIILPTATPAPTPTIGIVPTFILPTFNPTPSPTPSLILRTVSPSIIIFTPAPTPAPTPTPVPTLILRTVSPTFFILPTPTPTPLPTISCRLFGCP